MMYGSTMEGPPMPPIPTSRSQMEAVTAFAPKEVTTSKHPPPAPNVNNPFGSDNDEAVGNAGDETQSSSLENPKRDKSRDSQPQ